MREITTKDGIEMGEMILTTTANELISTTSNRVAALSDDEELSEVSEEQLLLDMLESLKRHREMMLMEMGVDDLLKVEAFLQHQFPVIFEKLDCYHRKAATKREVRELSKMMVVGWPGTPKSDVKEVIRRVMMMVSDQRPTSLELRLTARFVLENSQYGLPTVSEILRELRNAREILTTADKHLRDMPESLRRIRVNHDREVERKRRFAEELRRERIAEEECLRRYGKSASEMIDSGLMTYEQIEQLGLPSGE